MFTKHSCHVEQQTNKTKTNKQEPTPECPCVRVGKSGASIELVLAHENERQKTGRPSGAIQPVRLGSEANAWAPEFYYYYY